MQSCFLFPEDEAGTKKVWNGDDVICNINKIM